MKFLIAAPVFLLMVSIGMSLRVSELIKQWRRLTLPAWIRLLLATFILPPLFILLVHRVIPLNRAEAVGLFMVAVVPGAPLTTRNIARRGFNMQLAASYQVWGAILTPVIIPLVVHATGKLYDRDIWISPLLLIREIGLKQFVPVLIGMLCVRLIPETSKRLAPALNIFSNLVLVVVIVLVMVKIAPTLIGISVWLPITCVLLALVCIAAIRLLTQADLATERTLAICNANRFAGLAILMAGESLHRTDVVPSIACYALVVALATILYPKFFPAPLGKAAAG